MKKVESVLDGSQGWGKARTLAIFPQILFCLLSLILPKIFTIQGEEGGASTSYHHLEALFKRFVRTNLTLPKIKNGGNMKTIKVMAFAFIVFITLTGRLFPIIYGSVSGIVTDEDTGKGVPNVGVSLSGRVNLTVDTDKDGKFVVKLLKPGKYEILFTPSFPHCNVTAPDYIYIGPGKNIIYNKVVKLGGSIRGKVLYSDSKKPFPGVSIHAFARFAGSEFDTTMDDGSYFLGGGGRMCSSPNYYIKANCNIPNVAYKVLLGVVVEKGMETKAEDILFDLNDPTGIDGIITSLIDGKPLKNVHIAIFSSEKKYPGVDNDKEVEMGDVYTDSGGYYYIKNLEPGIYWIYILPPIADEWSFYEFSSYCKEKKGIVVAIGKKTRVNSLLDIPSSDNSMRKEENE
jgi:hypothetical protein